MNPKRILMFSPPLFGHIVPLLELARRLADSEHSVSFVTSQSKISEISKRNLLPLTYESNNQIRFLGLEDGNDEDYEQASPSSQYFFDIAYRLDAQIIKAATTSPLENWNFNGIEESFDIVVTDFSLTTPVEICRKRRVLCYVFSAFSANLLRHMLRIRENSPVVSEESISGDAVVDDQTGLPKLLKSTRDFVCRIIRTLPLATALLVNSFRSFETNAVNELEEQLNRMPLALKFVGPLLPDLVPPVTKLPVVTPPVTTLPVPPPATALPATTPPLKTSTTGVEGTVITWLNGQKPRSVVYVSFGSMVVLKKEQIEEISDALLCLNKPCLWSLRQTQHHFLPKKFQTLNETVLGGKILILPWVPQKSVLGHCATGVFVTHNGWNSTLESVACGVPMVSWPMKDDQHLNAQSVAENGIGVTIPKTELTGARIVQADEICGAISAVFAEGKENFFTAAKNLSKIAQEAIDIGGSSSNDFRELFNH